MSQVSSTLRRASEVFGAGVDGYVHWCPACEEAHRLPGSWTFNQGLEKPTFTPSFKHTISFGHKPDKICHYIVTDGVLNYCGDCTHALAGKSVPLPDLPEHLRD